MCLFFSHFNVDGYENNYILLANAFGIWLSEEFFDVTFRSTGIPTRYLAEKFVQGGWSGKIPTVAQIVANTKPEGWMFTNARDIGKDGMFTHAELNNLNNLTDKHIEGVIND